jgi:CBS domain-containing protein
MTKVRDMTVADIMQAEVTTVSPETSVRELTRILSDRGISGAPVVTSTGSVVGVVSSTDIVRLAADESELRLSSTHWSPLFGADAWDRSADPEDEEVEPLGSYFLPESAPPLMPDWDGDNAEAAFDQFTVADIMTPVSFTVAPSISVKELADFLLRGRIHRAIVTENDHLVGIVTTMDVLRALAEG